MKLRRTKKAVIIAWTAVIVWMSFIFSMSSQPADQSKQTSGGVAEIILRLIVPDFGELELDEQAQMIESIQHFVRKSAHFCAYALLGSLLFTAYLGHFRGLVNPFFLSVVTSAMYAASDELHQRFVPGRSGEIADVLLDSSGALLGVTVCCVITFLWRKRKDR